MDDEAMKFVEELKALILSRHPEATFGLRPGGDNPTAIFLVTYVDLDDPFEVLDEISDRVVDIQIDEGIPLNVLPLRNDERELAYRMRRAASRPRQGA